MVELYHPCTSTRGESIYWDGMLGCKTKSKQHLHGQLKAELTMNWDWNGWKRTLRNIRLRCLYHWIDLLLMLTIPVKKGKPHIRILDGHDSHLTWQFFDFCLKKKIHPICLPAHSSHILQPLEVGLFCPHCCCYSNELDIWVRKGGNATKRGQFYKQIYLLYHSILHSNSFLQTFHTH